MSPIQNPIAFRPWPGIGQALPLDIACSLLILCGLIPLALRTLTPYTANAKFSEALLLAGAARIGLVEGLAISGDGVDVLGAEPGQSLTLPRSAQSHLAGSAQAGAGPVAAAVGHGPADAHLGADLQERLRNTYEQKLQEREARAVQGSQSRHVSEVRLQDHQVLVSGRITGYGGADYRLSLYPATLDVAVPQVLVWQCGPNRLPDGWVGPTPQPVAPPPSAWLPALCRAGRALR